MTTATLPDLRCMTVDELAELIGCDDGAARAAAIAEIDRRDAQASRRAARRMTDTAWAEAAHAQYLEAERVCRGHLLSARGQAAGITEWSLWSGPEHVARAYGSEELCAFWDAQPRLTVTAYRDALAADRKDERETARTGREAPMSFTIREPEKAAETTMDESSFRTSDAIYLTTGRPAAHCPKPNGFMCGNGVRSTSGGPGGATPPPAGASSREQPREDSQMQDQVIRTTAQAPPAEVPPAYRREAGDGPEAEDLAMLPPGAEFALPGQDLERAAQLGLVQMSTVTKQRRRWIAHGIVAEGEVATLTGSGGDGKGLYSIDLATRVSNGWPDAPLDPFSPDTPPGAYRTPGNVILIVPEDDVAKDVKARLDAAGADQERVFVMSEVARATADGNTARGKFSLPQDLPLLAEAMRAVGDVRLVIIDPIMAVATTTVSFNQQVRHKIIEPLQAMAAQSGAGILVVMHFVKGMTLKNIQAKIGGSKGIVDACRVNNALIRNPENAAARLIVKVKSNVVDMKEKLEFTIVVDEEADSARIVWIPTSSSGSAAAKYERILVALTGRINTELGRAASPQELASALGIAYPLVMQLLSHAELAGLVVADRGGYSLPGHTGQAIPGAPAAAIAPPPPPVAAAAQYTAACAVRAEGQDQPGIHVIDGPHTSLQDAQDACQATATEPLAWAPSTRTPGTWTATVAAAGSAPEVSYAVAAAGK